MFNRKRWSVLGLWLGLIVGFVFGVVKLESVNADGTEQLGAPVGVTIAQGSGIVAAGVGISDTLPATLVVTVPNNSAVQQVLLYWSGGMINNVLGSNVITVSGQIITGTDIGGPTFFFRDPISREDIYFSAFRADITALNLVTAGVNTLSVESQPFSAEKDGVGVLVIYDDGTGDARADIRDGIDVAYHGFGGDRQVAVPQIFTFPALTQDRRARLSMFFGSVDPNEDRSSIFTITVDSTVVVTGLNLLGSNDGPQWDTVNIDFDIPAGATSTTVEVFSPPNAIPNGASFSWMAAGFFLLEPIADIQIRKYTNGADADDPNGTDVPELQPNAPVTWTYVVTNTGNVTLTQSQITVTDSQPGITVTLDINSDNGDGVLSPAESWLYVATGNAVNLGSPPGGITVVDGCAVGTTTRPTYRNIGRVTIVGGGAATNPSHYCNPPVTGIEEEEEPEQDRIYYIPYVTR